MLNVRCERVLSQGDLKYAKNAALCCLEEQNNILLTKLESHTSRETPKILIMPERHVGNEVFAFYLWPWVQRILSSLFQHLAEHNTPTREEKTQRTGFHSCKHHVCIKSWERLLTRLIHIMMYFTSYSQQIRCNMSSFMYHERYMSTQACEGWGSLSEKQTSFAPRAEEGKNWKFTYCFQVLQTSGQLWAPLQ